MSMAAHTTAATSTGLSERCGPGDSFFAPRGLPHAIKNISDSQARILIVRSPGGVIERYMEEAWETIEDPSSPPAPSEPDFERVMAVAREYGIEMLPRQQGG